ncbi:MAG: hypothetical protein Q8R55_04780 [Candidatus Taylorbacteria bacterium]|nr:hypothetical protein [Candidatus Taylorbacteria bacterium]
MAKKRKHARKSKLDSKKIAKDLGAKHIIGKKEKKDFEKKYGWPRPLVLTPKKEFEIDWHGNSGHCCPTPGTVETAVCGICGMQMSVQRNVLRASGSAEAMAGRKHRFDFFECPRHNEDWHKRIYHLKMGVCRAEFKEAIDFDQLKQIAEKEILKLLKANARQ